MQQVLKSSRLERTTVMIYFLIKLQRLVVFDIFHFISRKNTELIAFGLILNDFLCYFNIDTG